MCGICGVIELGSPTGPPVGDDVLALMTDSMTHRGPDDRGTHTGPGIALGVRRLSIVDVVHGHQPFYDEATAIVAVQNGELYNHEAIRRDLEARGHIFRTRCDTEILPHLYEEVDAKVPERLLGMFGLAVWDGRRRRGLIARDRLGIKPMYYAEADGRLVFGSELKAVLMSGLVRAEIDVCALDLYLSLGFVPAPWTLLRGVRKLMPGERLVIDGGSYRAERYWTYPSQRARDDVTEAEWHEELLALLDDAVNIRLMSDVPLGAMLSGGLDSSLVVALMARHMREPVKTFAVGFAGVADNELAASRNVARAFGTEHHELELSLDDPVDLDGLVWSLDEPLADLSAVGFSALSELTSRHVTVALSGQGADELLAGYNRYRDTARMARAVGAPSALRHAAAGVGRLGPERARRAARVVRARNPVAASVLARSEWADGGRSTWAGVALRSLDNSALESMLDARSGSVHADLLARSLELDAQLNLPDDMLHYFDRTSMRYSLEVRVPFLDHRVVELCAGIPTRLKLNRGVTKYLLREIARDLVPAEVLARPKVGFFSGAVSRWLATQIDGLLGDVLLDPGARYTAYVDPTAVEQLLSEPSAYRRSKLLLAILMLELWLTTFLPRATTPSTATASAA